MMQGLGCLAAMRKVDEIMTSCRVVFGAAIVPVLQLTDKLNV
jgi:hypothetical protein